MFASPVSAPQIPLTNPGGPTGYKMFMPSSRLLQPYKSRCVERSVGVPQ